MIRYGTVGVPSGPLFCKIEATFSSSMLQLWWRNNTCAHFILLDAVPRDLCSLQTKCCIQPIDYMTSQLDLREKLLLELMLLCGFSVPLGI